MSLSPFDYVKNIYEKNKYLSDEELEGYSQWMVNNILASESATIYLANELNKPMSDRMHYDFLFYGLPKKEKKYTKYLFKKEKCPKDIQYLSDYFNVSKYIAEQYLSLISKEDLDGIKEFFEKRGTK